MEKCNICKMAKVKVVNNYTTDFDIIEIRDCEKCGVFHIESCLYNDFDVQDIPHMVSSYIKEENLYNKPPLIYCEDDFNKLLNIPDKRIESKYRIFLSLVRDYFASNSSPFNLSINEVYLPLIAECWCQDLKELQSLVLEGVDRSHIKNADDHPFVLRNITFKGREFLETALTKNSNTIFMAFHFTDEMKKQFEPTIMKAVSEASNGELEAVRVSSSSTDHDTKIDDELIAMLKSSKAVIADFTGNRTAVYYEAGYAMALGIPVIWTCKDTDIDELSFDTRQYPHIVWKNEKDLYTQVLNRIKAKLL